MCDHLALPLIAVDTHEGRTPEFLKLNKTARCRRWNSTPARTLAQSNAIIRYGGRGSGLIPSDAFAEGKDSTSVLGTIQP